MKTRILILGLVVFGMSVLPVPGTAQNDDVEIFLVVNAQLDLSNVSASTIKNIYLGKLNFWPETSVRAIPIQRPESSTVGRRFFKSILKMAPSRYRHQWQQRQLAGKGTAPDTISSAKTLNIVVGASKGAVAYILESEKEKITSSRVKVISLK